jgi:DNA/RNA-binding domain of Phe-tRNA-synthetase-like protein
VLDAAKVKGSTSFRVGGEQESYVFNPSGQELRLKGLLVICDQDGPTGSPVKDAQRTKVDDVTSRFLIVVWGTNELPECLEAARVRIDEWANGLGLTLSVG